MATFTSVDFFQDLHNILLLEPEKLSTFYILAAEMFTRFLQVPFIF